VRKPTFVIFRQSKNWAPFGQLKLRKNTPIFETVSPQSESNIKEDQRNLVMKRRWHQVFLAIMATMLLITYFLKVKQGAWYDEAALIDNAKNKNIEELRSGLNWLQTIPIGYFVLAKSILQIGIGVEILRVISMVAFLLGTIVAVRNLFPADVSSYHKSIFAFAVLCNPISITYATMVKPYAIEFLMGIIGLSLFKREKYRALILLALIGPMFSNTTGILLASIAVVMFLKYKRLVNSAMIIMCVGASTLLSLHFTAPGTREMMKTVWFGDIQQVGLLSLKSAIVSLGWLPVSGLGLLPESGSSQGYFFLSTFLFLIAFAFNLRSDLSWVLFTALGICVLAQTLLLIPITGRLVLGISGLIWCLIIVSISRLPRFSIVASTLIFLGVANSALNSAVWMNGNGNSDVKEVVTAIKTNTDRNQIFTNVWAAPATHFYLNDSSLNFSSNIIWIGENSRLVACQKTELQESSLIFLDNVSNSTLVGVGELPYLEKMITIDNTGVYKVNKTHPIPGLTEPDKEISCMYHWSNPRFPLKDPFNAN
jgi:hypothetical protein